MSYALVIRSPILTEPRAIAPLLLFLMIVTPARPAAADPGDADDLFQQGKALLERGLVAEACQKLSDSLARARRGGTLLNLAVCREKQGRFATALRLFEEARARADRDGRADREQLAREHVEALRPRLSWLTVQLAPGADVPGLVVRRDDAELPRQSWGVIEAIDPGEHTVTAAAPGRAPFEVRERVGADDARVVVTIPLLAPALERPSPAAAAPPPSRAATPVPPSRATAPEPVRRGAPAWKVPLGVGALVVGAAGVVTGAVLGIEAILDSNASKRLCPGDHCPTDEGFAANQHARTAATGSDIAFSAGLLVAGAGAALLISARPSAASVRLVPVVGPGVAGLSLRGAW